MNFESLKQTKSFFDMVVDDMNLLQDKGYVQLPDDDRLSGLYKLEFAEFIMYLIASDKNININEVEVYRYLTGYCGDDIDSIKEYIEGSDIMSYDFQSRIPSSLQFLVNATNRLLQYNNGLEFGPVLKFYLLSFIFAGREVYSSLVFSHAIL